MATATDLERLVVSLEANIKKYEAAMSKAVNQTNGAARKIEDRFKTMNKNVSGLLDIGGSAVRGLGVLGVGVSVTAGIRAISSAAQEYVALENALKVTGLEGRALEETMSSLFQIAQRNGTAIAPLTTLYSRAAQAQKELNASSADLLKFTDGVSIALRVAGTTSTQASGALLQLSQAIGGGVVRAEEFNSVNEGARPILQAVAAGLEEAGGSVAKLKTLVNEGKVSSEAFFRAFLAGMPQIEAQAAKASDTIGQAQERFANAFVALVGHLDKTTGASANAAKNLTSFAGVVEAMPGYFDGATQKLSVFQDRLTQLGNSDAWLKIAKFLGTDPTNKLFGVDVQPIKGASTPGGRVAEGANDPLGRAPVVDIKPVSLKDFAVPGAKESGGARLDPFERSTAQIEKRIALLQSEAQTIGLGAAARERARVVIELETAARRANEMAGLKNTEVTEAQRAKISELADAYARAVTHVEAMNTPLAQLARTSADVNARLNEMAASSLDQLGDGLADIATGAASAKDVFRNMANAIISDLARIAIRASIVAPLANLFSGGLGGGGGLLAGLFRANGGPVAAGQPYIVGERGPEVFVPSGAGMVVPNHVAAKSRGGGVTVVVHNNPVFQAGMTPTDMAAIEAKLAHNSQLLRAQIPNDIRRGLSNDSGFLGHG